MFVLAFPFAVAGMLLGPAPVQAQNLGQVVSPILLVDRERMYAESDFGQRTAAVLEAERARMEAETRQIEADLKAEELALTEDRKTLTPEAFRARADAFDAKVVALRRERDQAQETLVAEFEKARAQFLQQVSPILASILRDHGALVMLDRRVALLAASEIDVTTEAIRRIDAALADVAPNVRGGPEGQDGQDGQNDTMPSPAPDPATDLGVPAVPPVPLAPGGESPQASPPPPASPGSE